MVVFKIVEKAASLGCESVVEQELSDFNKSHPKGKTEDMSHLAIPSKKLSLIQISHDVKHLTQAQAYPFGT